MAAKKTSPLVRKICSLLKVDETEYQCAAALVLGELGSKDPFIVKSLGEVLTNGDCDLLKGHILDAFKKIKTKESLKYILPFLFKHTSIETTFGKKAIAIASSLGPDSARELKSLLRKAKADERRVINSVFIKMRTIEGLKVVLDSLFDEDESVVSDICSQMKEEMKDLTPKERKMFNGRVERFLLSPRTRKSLTATSAAVSLLGYIADQSALDCLLLFSSHQNHPTVRNLALNSLREIPFTEKVKNDVIRKLVSYLNERDFTNIVSPTLDILTRAPVQSNLSDLFIKLLDSSHDAVKLFSLRKMREFNTIKVVKVLIINLSNRNPRIRDVAAESLCWLDTARNPLIEKLLAEDDIEQAWLLARILKPHSTRFRNDQVKKLGEKLKKHLESGTELSKPIIFLLKMRSPDFLQELFLNRAMLLKKKKKFKDAVELLKVLEKNEHIMSEGRYIMAVCLLKQSKKVNRKPFREDDPCLSLFQQLIRNDNFPLLQRMKSDSSLEPADRFYVGYHFSEKSGDERLFGGDLLRSLARRKSKAKVILASREKIRSEGL